MMPRVIKILTVFVAVSLVLLIPLGLLESRRTPDWQTELSRYLNMSGVSLEEIQRVEVAQAQHPERFAARLLQVVPTGWAWDGINRIPFPEEVQCVRIERQRPAGQGTARSPIQENLLVGYHDDGQWRAGWLVHQFQESVSEEEQQALLTRMGCTHWMEISIQTLSQLSSGNSPHVVRTPNVIEIFATQIAPTPTPSATPLPTPRSEPTAGPTPHERHFPPSNAPLPVELAAPRSS